MTDVTPAPGDRLRAALAGASGVSPDEAARAQARARQVGAPRTALVGLPQDQWPSTQQNFDVEGFLRDYPRTSRYLETPANAQVAGDARSRQQLGALEQQITRSGFVARPGDTLQPLRRPNTPGQWLRGIGTALTSGEAWRGSQLALGDALGLWRNPSERAAVARDYESEAARVEMARPEISGNIASGIYGGLESTARLAPATALSILLRNPAPVLATAGGSTGGAAYGKYSARGATGAEAAAGAVGEGAVEVVTELLPMGHLVRALGVAGGKRFITEIGKSVLTDIPGEQLATLAQDAIDTAIANPDKTWGDYLAERPDAAAQTLVSSLTQSLLMGGSAAGVRAAGSFIDSRAQQAAEVETDASTIANLVEGARASDLRSRSPESFAEFVAQASEGGPVENLYVSAEALNQSGVDIAALRAAVPAIDQQLDQASRDGGDVQIPVEQFAANAVEIEGVDGLIDHLRINPALPSRAEVAALAQEATGEAQAEAARIIADATTQDAFRQSAERVETGIFDQLQTAGRFTRDVNRSYASLVGSFYTVQAQRLGITPEQMAERYPLKIIAELPQATRETTLDQSPEAMDARFREEASRVVVPEGATGHDEPYKHQAALRVAAGDAGGLSSFRPGNTEVDRAFAWAFDNSRTDVMGRILARAEKTLAEDEAEFEAGSDTFRKNMRDSIEEARAWVENLRSALSQKQRENTQKLAGSPQATRETTLDQVEPDRLQLVHYSRTPGLVESDPTRWGSNRATPQSERNRTATAPGRTYFYDRARRPTPETSIAKTAPFRYGASVLRSSLYDFDADPQNLRPVEGADTASAYENAIRDAGFAGYFSNAVVDGAVAVFDPMPLRAEGLVQTVQQAQAVERKQQELQQAERRARQAGNPEIVASKPLAEFRNQALREVFPDAALLAPIEGAPKSVKVDGERIKIEPFPPAREAAAAYMASRGLRYEPPTQYAKVDTGRATRLAEAFDMMAHAPNDPVVRAAYNAMIEETLAQYQFVKATGLEIEFIAEGQADPYAASPRLAIADVVENNHLWVFPTDAGFGGSASAGVDISGNPLLAPVNEWIGDRQLLANDVFRIVHDYFGHVKDGHGFRADGEENAWQSHAAMYSPLARRAMTTETRGQNSWVNYGPFGEFNKTANASETQYAPQKIGLLPTWADTEGFLGGEQSGTAAGVLAQGPALKTDTPEFKAWFGDSKVVDESGQPLVVYHGTGADFDAFSIGKSGSNTGAVSARGTFFFTEGTETANDYAYLTRSNQEVKAWERVRSLELRGEYDKAQALTSSLEDGTFDNPAAPNVLPVYLSLQNPLVFDFEGQTYDTANTEVRLSGLVQQARDEGRDGLVLKNLDDGVMVNDSTTHYVVFEPTQIKSVFNQGTFDPADPRILYQSASLRSGAETLKKYGLDPSKRYSTREVARALEARQRAKYGVITKTDRTPAAAKRIANWMAEEVQFEMQNPNSSGVGWYSTKFQAALDTFAQEFSELKTDQGARDLMTALIAITSDGQKVVPNFQQAAGIYRNFKREGRFVADRGTRRQSSVDSNLAKVQELYDTLGAEGMREALLEELTVSELKKKAAALGVQFSTSYQASVRLPLAALVFGPKLGAFYANLMGADGYLTTDRWWSRTFNRYRGTLLQAPTPEGIARFRELLGQPELTDEEVVAATIAPRNSYAARNFKDGTEIEKAANTIYKAAFENLEDQPFNATDRTFMLQVVDQARKVLARRGVDISVADIQAVLWYYEKRLYGELGARQTADISYEEAAQRVVEEAGMAGPDGQPVLVDGDDTVTGFDPGDEDFEGQYSLDQRNRGQIAFGNDITQTPSVISLLQTADLSTFLHETGHFFLEVTRDMAARPDAPAEIKADMDTLLGWFGVSDLDTWSKMGWEEKRKYHEQFARGFEAYLFEGRAPTPRLRELFQRFRSWLLNVYRSLTQLNVELTDDVRGVLGRMVAADDEIVNATAGYGLTPLAEKPPYMDDASWADYQAAFANAEQEGVDTLTTRSVRDMKWLSNARSKALRRLQAQAREQRRQVKAEVTAEVMAEPVNIARAYIRRGVGPDGEPIAGAVKLDRAALEEMFGTADDALWRGLRTGGKYGEVQADGMHPDVAAEMFGYDSGDALVRDMVSAEDANEKIAGMTDQRMLERYGEIADQAALERAADEAIANDAHVRAIATDYAALAAATGQPRALAAVAREHAASIINRIELRRLKPHQFFAAMTRAGKAADKAARAGDLPKAAQYRRAQLINLQAAKYALEAKAEVDKALTRFTRIVSANDEALARSRDMALVNASRAILSAYGIGRVKNDPAAYLDRVKSYDPQLYADIQPFVEGATGTPKPIDQISYEQFQGLRDTVNQLWVLSRRTRQIELDGRLVDIDVARNALAARLDEIGYGKQVGQDERQTPLQEFHRNLQGARAALRRVESWTRAVDAADFGPFRSFIWNPVSSAADRYRIAQADYLRRFLDIVKPIEASLTKAKIAAPEIGYIFTGKAELLHAILHSGNTSNLSKLLLGRRWGKQTEDGALDTTRWDAFLSRAWAEGILTKADYDFAQGVWDLMEQTKPAAQAAHRAMYGRYFSEVTAQPVQTPFGEYRGGYVPATTDSFMVRDAQLREEQNALEDSNAFMFPAASNGFTKSRVEDYTRELALDVRLLPMHIDKVLKFTHLGPPVRDVARVLRGRAFAEKLDAFDPVAASDLLLPWLQRAARQVVQEPSKGRGGKLIDGFFRELRSRTGMQIMFANLANVLQQVTSFSNAAVRVKPGHIGKGMWAYVRDPKGTTEAITGLSDFMASRTSSQVFEMRQTIEQLLLNPSKYEKLRDFSQRHAYFAQTALQNITDLSVWHGAYNQSLERGDSERDAVRFADSVIRETQGSMAPEDISRFETGTAFQRAFTQFYSYFNNQANLLGTGFMEVARTTGVKKGAGQLFYLYVTGFAIPSLLAQALADLARGGWDDEDEDGYLDSFLNWFFGSQFKFALASVPIAGPVINAALGGFTPQSYDDRVSISPAISLVESSAALPAAYVKAVEEGEPVGRKEVRDTMTLLGLLTGLPIGAAGRPVAYGYGVATGEIEPTSALDATRGAVTGAPSKESLGR